MSSAKTEDPTPQRIRELRKKGDVPLSRELNKTASLVGALLAMAAVGPGAIRLLGDFAAEATRAEHEPVSALVLAGTVLLACALPVVGAAAIAAVAMGGIQTGLVFAPGRILPDAQRFKPGQAWSAKLKLDAWVNGGIALTATLVGAAVAAVGVRRLVRAAPDLATLAADGGAQAVAAVVADTMAVVGASWLGIAALVAIIDAVWQRKAFMRRNRMSNQEIVDEYKRSEGDPEHKARRERAHRELLRGDLRAGVAKADVVVVNPVRIAVGLRYRPEEVDAPVVTVTGRGDRAKAIKREARRKAVPEYVDRVAARAVVELDVDDTVPEELFEPIAVIFRWLSTLESESPVDVDASPGP